MSMLQLNPHLPVYARKHGYGDAFLVIDYGHDVNLVYVVRFPGGETKHFYSDDVLLVGNPMNGDGWDIKIPEGWEPTPKLCTPPHKFGPEKPNGSQTCEVCGVEMRPIEQCGGGWEGGDNASPVSWVPTVKVGPGGMYEPIRNAAQ